MRNIADLMERRAAVTAVGVDAFIQLDIEDRLLGSWQVMGENGKTVAPPLYALPVEDLTIGYGRCHVWDEACATQAVDMRTNKDLAIGELMRADDQPITVAPWLRQFAVNINDRLGLNRSEEANQMRRETFLPLVDALVDTRTSRQTHSRVTRRAGLRIAQLAATEVLPLALDAIENYDLSQELRSIAPLTNIKDVYNCATLVETLRGQVPEAALALDALHMVTRRRVHLIDAKAAGTYAGELCGAVAIQGQHAVGWPKVLDVAIPAFAEVIALSANPVLGQTHPDVAAAMATAA